VIAELPARRIEILPDDVANQIAAGEVVERPASVVKELVENALDAGATSIVLVIEAGGIARIAVTDDGNGMLADDLARSVLRHATSKIRAASDLTGVGTYGFRGEALPSVASVSRMKITTRPRGHDSGTELSIEGGSSATLRPAGCAPGTTVSVEDLFYNTPARRKFLRSVTTEASACVDVAVRLLLPRPEVRLEIRRDGKVVRELVRHDDVLARARAMWTDAGLAQVSGERGGIRVLGLLGPPERARSGAAGLGLFVNGRHVRDRLLLRAVAQAYGSTLPAGRYPSGAVMVEVPAEDIDVNVHPQKTEVRFARQSELFGALVTALRDGLARAPWARAVAGTSDPWAGHFDGPAYQPPSTPSLFSVADRPATASPTPSDPDPWGLAPDETAADDEVPRTERPVPSGPAPSAHDSRTPDPDAPSEGFRSLRFLAQAKRMFLLCEGDVGLVVLDQHAAAERVTFERLRRAYASRQMAMQSLLVPERIEVTAGDVARVEEQAETLARAGVEFSVLGPTTLLVRAIPALLTRLDPANLARDVLAELAREGDGFSRAMDLVLATLACHGSARAGDTITEPEARALLEALDEVDFAGHCPHGRPLVWSMRWAELERKVGR